MKTLSFEQMEQINAGGWLANAWNAVCDVIVDVWYWIEVQVRGGSNSWIEGLVEM
jgi:hypothetical protein